MSPEGSDPQESNKSWLGSTNYQADSDQEQNVYRADRDARPGGDDPDVVLDVPLLQIDEIDLEVEDLRLHVSLRAELADLVKVNAGIDAYLDNVKLSVKGLEAQAVLKIGLKRVLETLDRALETIDRNPQILGGTVRGADQTAQDAGRASPPGEATTGETGEAGQATGRALERPESGDVTESTSNGSNEVEDEEATGRLAGLRIEEEYVDERARIVGRARDEAGNVVEEVLDEEGRPPEPGAPEGTQDREPEGGENGAVNATDSARREAGDLGVKLSIVRGTGSGGRILLRDVRRVAKRSADTS